MSTRHGAAGHCFLMGFLLPLGGLAAALSVWGVLPREFGDGAIRVEIAQSYRLRPGSPCLGAGENGSNIGVQK